MLLYALNVAAAVAAYWDGVDFSDDDDDDDDTSQPTISVQQQL